MSITITNTKLIRHRTIVWLTLTFDYDESDYHQMSTVSWNKFGCGWIVYFGFTTYNSMYYKSILLFWYFRL